MNMSEAIPFVTTAIPGIVGLVLSIINTRADLRRDIVRLEIKPEHPPCPPEKAESLPYNLSVEIVNHSDFPVTIASIGFLMNDGRHVVWPQESVMRMFYCIQRPFRLESHASCLHSIFIDRAMSDFEEIIGVYAETQCGAVAVKRRSAILTDILTTAATYSKKISDTESTSAPSSSTH